MEENLQEQLSQPVEQVEQVETQVQQAQEDTNAQNLRALRNSKEELEKKNRELLRRLKEIEDQKAQPQQQYDPEDLVQRSYVDQRYQQLEKQVQHASLLTQYPDFNKVVNDATINALQEKNPYLAAAIGQSGDYFTKASAAYEAIKNLGIYVEDKYVQDRERAQINAQKPHSMQSIAPSSKPGSPLSTINSPVFDRRLTPQQKDELWKEINALRSGSI